MVNERTGPDRTGSSGDGAGPGPDGRKAAILRAVVEEYIQTAQPVASAHVARGTSLAVSPATVRNEMAALERDGFLVHPHTSAGRVPTEKAYRFFVDHLSPAPGGLAPAHHRQVDDFFAQAHGELEQMLHDTGRLLSELTHLGALVVAPRRQPAAVLSVQLVGLASRAAVAVAVLANGEVAKGTLELPTPATDQQLASAQHQLGLALIGRSLADEPALAPTGDVAVDRLASAAASALRRGSLTEPDQVFVGGTARVASMFDAVETILDVLAILEQQFVVVGLLRQALHHDRLSVAIGTEHGVVPLADCSIVAAPFEAEGSRVGTIGVLGPTRMNYPQAIAAVAVVSQGLGRRLREGA